MKDNIEEEEKATDGVWCHLFGKMNLIRRGICFILFYFFGGMEAIISKCPLRLGKKNQNVACDVFIHNVFIRAEIIEREKKKNGEGGIG